MDIYITIGLTIALIPLTTIMTIFVKGIIANAKEIDPSEAETPEWKAEYLKALWELDKEFPATKEAKEPATNKIVSGSYNKVLSPGLYGLFKDQQNVYQQHRESFEQQLMQAQPGQLVQLQNQQQLGNISMAGLAGQQDLAYLLGVKRKGEPN